MENKTQFGQPNYANFRHASNSLRYDFEIIYKYLSLKRMDFT